MLGAVVEKKTKSDQPSLVIVTARPHRHLFFAPWLVPACFLVCNAFFCCDFGRVHQNCPWRQEVTPENPGCEDTFCQPIFLPTAKDRWRPRAAGHIFCRRQMTCRLVWY
ncbi:hypothetical protein TW95_gp0059 [Pandoravirus inopinatum]|uniref:Uncharacterized protein n=1 Tax=Pandoravirus inopinatum TaxID=1605721 RepID=A0A0B5IVV5_9VIRU|nr:hypothetical protein TW95_gp0059 [Pandoravirus inopinatum]AJF96793.1 hypothetical protein [Pandoravirus inopinatum]